MSFTERILSRKYVLWLIPVSIFLCACLAEVFAIVKLNGGVFTYTLDDIYIHLALSENIARGHYGVNLQEYSAPSSSILWPFLFVPFAKAGWFAFIPLLLNILLSVLTIIVLVRFLENTFKKIYPDGNFSDTAIILLASAFIFCANFIALTFMGMEHVLQVLCSVAIVAGICAENETGKFPGYAVAALIVAPMVRYENAALSGSVILLLLYRRHYTLAIVSALIIACVLVGFSLFLHSLDLGFIPTSIAVKSRAAWQSNKVFAVLKTLLANVTSRQGTVLLALLVLFIKPAFTHQKKKRVAIVMLVAILFHLVFGDCTSGRYTNYITAASLTALFYVYGEPLLKYFVKSAFLPQLFTIITATFFIGGSFLTDAALTPVGANNIYEQQYQMGRFVREFYKKPVAINDLGLVSFKNDFYVLDLWGLASHEAFTLRSKELSGEDAGDWMNALADRRNVKFAMIYEDWFPKIPHNWKKVAVLKLSRQFGGAANMHIGAAKNEVAFFSLDAQHESALLEQLAAFKSTLPQGVDLEILE